METKSINNNSESHRDNPNIPTIEELLDVTSLSEIADLGKLAFSAYQETCTTSALTLEDWATALEEQTKEVETITKAGFTLPKLMLDTNSWMRDTLARGLLVKYSVEAPAGPPMPWHVLCAVMLSVLARRVFELRDCACGREEHKTDEWMLEVLGRSAAADASNQASTTESE